MSCCTWNRGKVSNTVGSLCSIGITRLPRYYGPLRHPLAFGSLPGFAGYRTYLAPVISHRGEEGFSSCLACPCQRAVASTPPKCLAVSVRFRRSMLLSSYGCRLSLRISSLSRPHPRSLSLRPADSSLPFGVVVDRLRHLGFPQRRYPNYGVPDCYPGRTDSC